MALPTHLARYQSLLDLLVEAALREMDGETEPLQADEPEPRSTLVQARADDPEGCR